MKIYYRVLAITDDEHSIEVRYWTDNLKEDDLVTDFDENDKPILNTKGYPARCRTDVNITLWDNKIPNVKTLEKIIKNNAPVHWFKLKNIISKKDGSLDLNAANELLGQERSFDIED